MGFRSRLERGGTDGRVAESGRSMERTTEGRTPRGRQGTERRSRAEKGGRTDEGHGRHMHAAQDSRVREGPGHHIEYGKGGKSIYKLWGMAGGGDV